MLKISFTHAEVRDSGFGLEVNGKSLEDIISEALGTRAKGLSYGDERLKQFHSNSCDVTVIIEPHAQKVEIETEDEVFYSVEEMEEIKREQFGEKAGEGSSES